MRVIQLCLEVPANSQQVVGQTFNGIDTFNPGANGDWAIAIRFQLTTDSYNSNYLIQMGAGGGWDWDISVVATWWQPVQLIDSPTISTSLTRNDHNASISQDTFYVCVVNFDSSDSPNYAKVYVDGVDDTSTRTGDLKAHEVRA